MLVLTICYIELVGKAWSWETLPSCGKGGVWRRTTSCMG